MKVRLKDQTGSFVDPVSGFSITRDEIVDWPENPGELAEQFKRLGHIIEAIEEKSSETKKK